MDFSTLSPEERLVAEPAVLTLRAVTEAASQAPFGHGMRVLEEAIPDHGFAHLRQIVTTAGASHRAAQKKGVCITPCPCGKERKFKGMSGKTILTSIGHITLPRRRYRCPGCGQSQMPWDAWAGMGKRSLTPRGRSGW